jgi:NAD(P)-dependent dehydrogenase (short-subunit alcohol dehydrogenase family)
MTQRFDGKVAAITGGGSGIGEATAIALAEEGARVAALDINQDGAELTAKLAGDGLGLELDLSDRFVQGVFGEGPRRSEIGDPLHAAQTIRR